MNFQRVERVDKNRVNKSDFSFIFMSTAVNNKMQELTVKQLMEDFADKMKKSNDPERFIIKAFMRHYLQSRLEADGVDKQWCTPSVLCQLSKLISIKLGKQFHDKHGKKWIRIDRYKILGIQLPQKLHQEHQKFYSTYIGRGSLNSTTRKTSEQTEGSDRKLVKKFEEEEESESQKLSPQVQQNDDSSYHSSNDTGYANRVSVAKSKSKNAGKSAKKQTKDISVKPKKTPQLDLQKKLHQSQKKIQELETVINYLMRQTVKNAKYESEDNDSST